jgi:hypothetical protein
MYPKNQISGEQENVINSYTKANALDRAHSNVQEWMTVVHPEGRVVQSLAVSKFQHSGVHEVKVLRL